MTATALAILALRTLRAQREYFTTRKHDALLRCKALERELKQASEEVIADTQQTLIQEDTPPYALD